LLSVSDTCISIDFAICFCRDILGFNGVEGREFGGKVTLPMHRKVEILKERYYPWTDDVYCKFEEKVQSFLTPETVLLDAGCGHEASPTLQRLVPLVQSAIGIDEIDFDPSTEPKLRFLRANLHEVPLPDASVDIVMARSVVEHLADPLSAYREFYRILKPGGRFIFATCNRLHYAIIASSLIPNSVHKPIVKFLEGRSEEDTFPTRYRSNLRSSIYSLAAKSGFTVEDFAYVGEWPSYLAFHPWAFRVGMAYDRITRAVPALAPLRRWIIVELRKDSASR